METSSPHVEKALPAFRPIEEESPLERLDDICCEMCSGKEVEEGYRLQLCIECRNRLVARPIPIWIKGTALLIIILLVYSLFQFPGTVRAGVDYKKGIQAEKEHRFRTAAIHFERAADRFPDSTLVLSKLFIAYYINGQIEEASGVLKLISGREASGGDMADIVNNIIDEMDSRYYQDDELIKINAETALETRIAKLREYTVNHPSSDLGQYLLANYIYDTKQYDEVERILLKLQMTAYDYDDATLLLAAAYRETGQFDKAMAEVKQVFDRNSESADAYYSLSRIEIKQHHDKQGLADALTAYDLNPNDTSFIANLALANHFNQKIMERDSLLSALEERKDYGEKELAELKSIFNGEIKWRD